MATNVILGAGAIITVVSLAPIIAGFGTVGIAAGSTAAAVQSGMGCVAAGSWFASMTSLGMQGVFVYGAAGGATVAVGAGAAILLEEQLA